MRKLERTLELLDQQCGDYRAMYRLSLEQRVCLEREDLPALQTSFARTHWLMDQIRLRQAQLPTLEGDHPEVEQRFETMRCLLVDLQELREFNQRAAQRLLEQTRGEMRRLDKGRRAVRGYQNGASPAQARLFDGTR